MNGWLILCDFAEVLNGKLYIQGGGWSRYTLASNGFSAHLGGKLLVPWTATNTRMPLVVALVTSDGHPVEVEGNQIKIEGDFEVGRPPGLAHGTELDVPLSFRFDGLPLEAGRYQWELTINTQRVAHVAFDVIRP